MDQALISDELERREQLFKAIDIVITQNFVFTPTQRLRRGAVQLFIMEQLSLSKSNYLCKLINERMANAGFIPYIRRGDFHYKNVAFNSPI